MLNKTRLVHDGLGRFGKFRFVATLDTDVRGCSRYFGNEELTSNKVNNEHSCVNSLQLEVCKAFCFWGGFGVVFFSFLLLFFPLFCRFLFIYLILKIYLLIFFNFCCCYYYLLLLLFYFYFFYFFLQKLNSNTAPHLVIIYCSGESAIIIFLTRWFISAFEREEYFNRQQGKVITRFCLVDLCALSDNRSVHTIAFYISVFVYRCTCI